MSFEQILRNKVFCMMYGLVMIEVMTPSGHSSNMNEMKLLCKDRVGLGVRIFLKIPIPGSLGVAFAMM